MPPPRKGLGGSRDPRGRAADHYFYADPASVTDDADLPPDLAGETGPDGVRHGVWRSRWPGGTLRAEVPFEAGRVHGLVRVFERDGRESRTEEWRAGRRHGRAASTDEHGVRDEVEFVEGLIEGEHRVVLPDGAVLLREAFRNGQPHGDSDEYGPDGSHRSHRSFRNGLPHGDWTLYDERGAPAVARGWFCGLPHGRHEVRGGRPEWWTHGVRTRGGFAWVVDGENVPGPPLGRIALFAGLVVAALLASPGAAATVLALALAIAVHELGHLVTARSIGIPIAELRVGFGPRICSFAVGATLVEIRAIPLFGFVRPAMIRPSAWPHVLHAMGRGPEHATEVDPDEAPVPAPDLAPPRRRVTFHLGGIAFNVLAAFVVRWLAFAPEAPHRAAAWVAKLAGSFLARVPEMLVSIVRPSTYTGGEGGLIAAGHDHVHGVVEALGMLAIINVLVAAFNLFPIPPLDGFHVAASGAEAMLGRERAERALRPLRLLGILVFAVLILSGLWFIGRDLVSVVTR